jgi:hypothetical protein
MALRELYGFITTQPTADHNKFRPQERLFTLLMLVRLNGDLSRLDDGETVTFFLKLFGVKKFRREM